MRVTKIYFSGKPRGDLLTYAHAEFDGSFAVHDMRIIRKPDGVMLLVMPGYLLGDKQLDLFHPVNKAARAFLEKLIFGAYEAKFSQQRPVG